MADISEFACQAADRFLERQNSDKRFDLGLPRQVVEEFIKSVFNASLMPDECRWPNVCLMTYRKECENQIHFRFEPAIEPSAQQIAKLAHAVANGSHLCCISKEGNLAIAGIHVTVLNERRDLGYAAGQSHHDRGIVEDGLK